MLEGKNPAILSSWSFKGLSIFWCLALFAFFTFTTVVQAGQYLPGGVDAIERGEITPDGTPIITPPTSGTGGRGTINPTPEDAAAAAAAAAANAAAAAAPVVQLNSYAGDTWYQVLFEWVVSGFGWLVAQLGHFLDYAIENFIVRFGEIYNTGGLGKSIDSLWGTVRDIFNLTFIFGLVYIGFQIILGANDSGAKRTIPLLIIAALLVNFSLFITKFIVDFSNLTATQIFNLFEGSNGLNDPASLSIAVTKLVGISTIFTYDPNGGYGGGSLVYLFGMMLVLLIIAYVFLASAIMITIRFVVLNIYMVLSPVMFLGWVFPGLASYTKNFWRGFLGQAFFAPAFLFMLYLSFTVLYGYNDGVSKYFADAFGNSLEVEKDAAGQIVNVTAPTDPLGQGNPSGGQGGPGSLIPFFALTCVFFIASLVAARKIGFSGGDMIISGAEKARGWAQGQVTGAAAGAAGYGTYKTLDKMANSDNRVARAIGGGLSKYTGLRDTSEKAYKNTWLAKSNEASEKRGSAMATRQAQAELTRTIRRDPKDDTAKQIAFEQAITDSSTSQIIKELERYAPEDENYERIVRALSPSQVGKIFEAKDDEFSPSQKADFAKVRAKMVKARLTSAPIGSPAGTAGPKFELAIERDASADDLKHLGLDTLRTNAAYITASKMDDLKTKLSPTEWSILNESRKASLWEKFNTSPTSVFRTVDGKRKKDNEIARLPGKILTDSNAVDQLNPKVLETIVRENYLQSEERAQIRKHINDAGLTSQYENFFKTPLGLTF